MVTIEEAFAWCREVAAVVVFRTGYVAVLIESGDIVKRSGFLEAVEAARALHSSTASF